MQEFYGIDLEETGLLGRRTWRWLSVRILGLLAPSGVVVPLSTAVGATVVNLPACRSRLAEALRSDS